MRTDAILAGEGFIEKADATLFRTDTTLERAGITLERDDTTLA